MLHMLGDFWVPMMNCFKGGALQPDLSLLELWPTGRIAGGNFNGVMSSFLRVPFSGSTRFDSGTFMRSTCAAMACPAGFSLQTTVSRTSGQSKPHEDECHACGFACTEDTSKC